MCRIRCFEPRPVRLSDLGSPRHAVTLLRLEGITASAAHRAAALAKALSPFGAAEILEDAASGSVWSAVRDVHPFAANGALGAWPVWRIVCPPASGGALGEALARDTGGDVIYDWGGGLIWAALPPKPDAQAGAGASARRGGRRSRHACFAPPNRCGAMSMYFIPSETALRRWANASATASIRKTSSIAAG